MFMVFIVNKDISSRQQLKESASKYIIDMYVVAVLRDGVEQPDRIM